MNKKNPPIQRSERVRVFLMEVGGRLREARTAKGMLQSELADRLSLKSAAISTYEIGQVEMPIGRLVEIADILDVSVEWLVSGRVTDKNGVSVEEVDRKMDEIRSALHSMGIIKPIDLFVTPGGQRLVAEMRRQQDERDAEKAAQDTKTPGGI